MSLTSHTAVVRRLIVSPGPAPQEQAPVVASAAAVSAVLRAFGRSPEDLPARTVVLIGSAAVDPALRAEHEGFTVLTTATPVSPCAAPTTNSTSAPPTSPSSRASANPMPTPSPCTP